MEELTILDFQAKEIEETLRLVANLLHSKDEVSCLDRMIMRSIKYIKASRAKCDMKLINSITPKGNY